MRRFIPRARWRALGVTLVGLLALAWCGRTWLVPALIANRVQAAYGGRATVRGWWVDAKSAGVVGLTLHEGAGADSPVLATVARVSAEIALADLLRGRFRPRRVTLLEPRVTLRLDQEARPLTRVPWKRDRRASKADAPVPLVVVERARVTVRQEGHPEMVVSGIGGRLAPDRTGASRWTGQADDPAWGHWDVVGNFPPGFRGGQIVATGLGVEASPEKEVCLPFIPGEVWKNVQARGPVDVRLAVRLTPGEAQPARVRTEITLRRAAVTLAPVGLTAVGTTGKVVVEDGLVRLNRVAGRSVGGGVEADGTMDFTRTPPRCDLTVKADGLSVAEAPAAWKLEDRGVVGGRLTGSVRIRASLAPEGLDLTGSSGEGVVRGATVQGVPVKSLRLAMRGEGKDVRLEAGGERGDADLERVAYGAALVAAGRTGQSGPGSKKMQFPRSFSTEIDLEDVELSRLVDKAAALGVVLPVEVAGRFSLKAEATIPLGALRDLKGYVFRGRVTLSGASVAGVDLGRASAHIALENGVLEVTDLRGRLVDLPDGGRNNRPGPTPQVPSAGPLPPGGFRGEFRAEISPPGRMSARVEANRLPVGELAAPYLPRPTPLSGLVSLDLNARADVAALKNPEAWAVEGTLHSEKVTYHDATLDAVSTRFTVEGGRLDVSELSAKLAGRPLSARVKAGLSPPYAYEGKVDVADWSIDDLLALIPALPRPAPAGGRLTVRADAKGTLAPWSVETRGEGRLAEGRLGPVPLGDVPFHWDTVPGAVLVSGVEARPLGGRLSAEARVPTGPGEPAVGSITALGVDAALLAAAMPGNRVSVTGSADVRVTFSVPTVRTPDAPAVSADVRLSASDLVIQGLPARGARAALAVRGGALTYEVVAETLDGKLRFDGDLPLAALTAGGAPSHARLQAGWFTLATLWKTEGVTGALTNLDGLFALGARVDLPEDPSRRRAQAVGELRGLRWGKTPLGNLRAVAALTPSAWRVVPLTGELLGGAVQGDLWGELSGPNSMIPGFDVKVDRLELSRLAAILPHPPHERDFNGVASVHLDGHPERFRAEVRVEQARVFDLPVADLRVPAEFLYAPESGVGLLQVRESSARLAGGLVRADARLRVGAYEDFRVDLQLSNVDLKAFKRVTTDERRPATGKVSGRVRLESPAARQFRRMRGTVHLDLTDASLFELPVFRQINQFLGSEQGGIFEAGELDLNVANGKARLAKLALVGRLIQLRARGTIGFDSLIDLEVIVKPNQVIPQAGRAVVSAVFGRGTRSRGDDDKVLRTANPMYHGPVKLRISGTLSDPKIKNDPSISFDED